MSVNPYQTAYTTTQNGGSDKTVGFFNATTTLNKPSTAINHYTPDQRIRGNRGRS